MGRLAIETVWVVEKIKINPYKFYFLLALTLITFLFYGYDKYQAINQKSRIPEVILHLLTLAGGTAGAIAGQLLFRHKTKKLSFRVVFIIIAAFQTGVIFWLYLRKTL